MQEALVLESLAVDRLLRELHLDHASQEEALPNSEPMEPWLIGFSSQYICPKGQKRW